MQFEFFKIKEFHCKCGRQHQTQKVDHELVSQLDRARKIAGIPFFITSGYRCPDHNVEVGGVQDSAHTKGKAADIKVRNSAERFKIAAALIKVGFVRLGIYDGYIHADIDETKPQNVLWL